MQLTPDQQSKIISAVISCIIAILTAFGYHIMVVQPALTQVHTLLVH